MGNALAPNFFTGRAFLLLSEESPISVKKSFFFGITTPGADFFGTGVLCVEWCWKVDAGLWEKGDGFLAADERNGIDLTAGGEDLRKDGESSLFFLASSISPYAGVPLSSSPHPQSSSGSSSVAIV